HAPRVKVAGLVGSARGVGASAAAAREKVQKARESAPGRGAALPAAVAASAPPAAQPRARRKRVRGRQARTRRRKQSPLVLPDLKPTVRTPAVQMKVANRGSKASPNLILS